MALSPALVAAMKAAKLKHRSGGTKTVKLKEGKTKVRILPNPESPDLPFWHDLGVHWIKPEPNAKPVAVVGCHDHTYDKPCPICTAIDKAVKSTTDDDTLKTYKEWQSRKSVLVNALIRSGADASEDPVVLELTSTTFANIMSIFEEYAEEGDVLDLDEGIDLVIERTGKGLDTKYSVMPAAKSAAVPKAVMSKLTNLAELVETEFFGKDSKALSAIGEISGVEVGITFATRAALTGPGSKVIDADADDVEVLETPKARKAASAPEADEDDLVAAEPPKKKSAAAAAEATVDDELPEDVEDILKDLDNL